MHSPNSDEQRSVSHAPLIPLRLTYGSEPRQCGDLSVPQQSGPYPTVILIHGGYWRARYGLDRMNGVASDLAKRGYAAWNIKYRRIGNPGGGWPGTLQDGARATDYVRELAPSYTLAPTKVVFERTCCR